MGADFLKDREFNGLYCVALVSIQKSYLIIMNDKDKLGFIDGYSVSTISDFVDKKKQMKLPPIPSKESIKDIGNYLVGKRCDLNKCKHTSRLSDVLYIKECQKENSNRGKSTEI